MNKQSNPHPHSETAFASLIPICAILLLFWGISLHNLAIVPRVYEDESWQASTGWKFARDGIFGSDLFAGWAGMEQHYYAFMPLHSLLLALDYRAAGLGLLQTRFEPVAAALLTLALTYALARRVFRDTRIGWLAVLLLISTRLSGTTPYLLTGILMIDVGRIARYDILVPVLGLAALHAYLSARSKHSYALYFLSGALAGLAGLAHVHGIFWLPVLVFLILADGGLRTADSQSHTANRISQEDSVAVGDLPSAIRHLLSAIRDTRYAISALLLGFVLPWLPYLIYVLSGIDDWRAQTRIYADRFDVLNPAWYLENVLQEYHRYGPGLGSSVPGLLTRVAFAAASVAVPLALGCLARRALRGDWRARVILIPALLLPILFALFVSLKLVNYAVTIFPLIAIAVSWAAVTLWSRLEALPGRRWLRPALALLLLAIVVEGGARVATLEAAARTTTPYAAFTRAVRQFVPPQTRVLGNHTFWLGLADHDYRAFLVPLAWADVWQGRFDDNPRPYPLDDALTRAAPDIVLLDSRLRSYFEGSPTRQHPHPALFFAWLAQHEGQLIGRVDDPTYGLMEIYRVQKPGLSERADFSVP